MTILVTGGAGFIGSNVVRGLVKRGESVRVLDDFSSGKLSNLNDVMASVEIVEGDVRDAETCEKVCRGVDGISHQAALSSVPGSIDEPITYHDVNVTGTLNLLRAARDQGTQRFVLASSASVYGDAVDVVKTEDLTLCPLSPYACTKLTAEAYALAFKATCGLNTVALRYFNVFGPFQNSDSTYAAVVPNFAARLMSSTPPTIFGDGEQVRDFTFIEDVVAANLLALTCDESACGEAYNVACGSCYSVNELFTVMRDCIGGGAAHIEPLRQPTRKGDVRSSMASIDKARSVLGYSPQVEFGDGIRRTVDWYLQNLIAPGGTAVRDERESAFD